MTFRLLTCFSLSGAVLLAAALQGKVELVDAKRKSSAEGVVVWLEPVSGKAPLLRIAEVASSEVPTDTIFPPRDWYSSTTHGSRSTISTSRVFTFAKKSSFSRGSSPGLVISTARSGPPTQWVLQSFAEFEAR